MPYSPIEDSFTTSYKYIDLMEKGQAFPADLIHPDTRLKITEHCREVRQASTQILSTTRTPVIGGPRPMLPRGTSALGACHRHLTRTAEPLLPAANTDDNNSNNEIHAIEHRQRISASAKYRTSIAALFTTLYPGYTADYHAQNSFNLPNHEHLKEDLRGAGTPFPETVDWPSPTVSEFLRVASPSTSWIDIDEYSDEHSSTSASQEEELPEVPHLCLGSPLVPVSPCGLFNVHEDGRVAKTPFCHRIPERAPSFENLQCDWDRPEPRGKYLRTLGNDGHVTYIPFSPVAKLQYAEPELLTSEELVALNQDSPLVLRVRRARARKDPKLVPVTAEPRCNGLSKLEAVRSWCNAADTTLPPPGLPKLTRSQLGADLARLRSRVVRLRSDMADKQLCQANKPEHFASEQGNIVQSTAPLADLDFEHPSLHRENATLGYIASGAVHRPSRLGSILDDRRRDDIVVDEDFRLNCLLRFPEYDRDNVELGDTSINEMGHPCHMGSTSANDRADGIAFKHHFHRENLLESPAYDRGNIELGDASIDTEYHPCRVGLTPNDCCSNDTIHNGSSRKNSLPQLPGLATDTVELGHADIGRVYRPRRVGLRPEDHRRKGVVFDQNLRIENLPQSLAMKQEDTELRNAFIYDTATSPYGAEHHWADYILKSEVPAGKPRHLVPPPAPRSSIAELAGQVQQDNIQPPFSEPEISMLSENSTGTVVVHSLRRRRGMIFDASISIDFRTVSASSSTTVCDVPGDSPLDPARIAYNRDLTLAIIEGRIEHKEFGSPKVGNIDSEASHRNSSAKPVFNMGGSVEMEVVESGAIPTRKVHFAALVRNLCDAVEPAICSSDEAERYASPGHRRYSIQWADQVPDGAPVLPLAAEIPINSNEPPNSDESKPAITSHYPSKSRRSPKTWVLEKLKGFSRIIH
ncbi:hypothetical protein MMC17_004559 [Xylographa soralifera]|nr:hypothetical protein [Xylographa soralifera]